MKKSPFTREYRILCEQLRAVRADAGVTQVELAKRLKETQSEVSKFERGERRLDLVQLRWWCDALGVKLKEFVAGFEEAIKSRK